MLLRGLPSCNKNTGTNSLFLPEGRTLFIGRGIYDALIEEGYKPADLDFVINNSTEVSEPIVLEDKELDSDEIKKIVIHLNGKTVFILCGALSDFSYQAVQAEAKELSTPQDSFGLFVEDMTGIKAKQKEKPIQEPKVEIAPKKKEEASLIPLRIRLWNAVKKDGLNPLFSAVFILLGLATELGYFFLGQGSSSAFRIACIVMMAVFPFMSCIPMGFLYEDKKCNRPTDSKFFLVSWIGVSLLGAICPLICLFVGLSMAWNPSDLTLFTCLGASSVLWIGVRITVAAILPNSLKRH